jgi:hypothetical protein
MSLPMAQLGIVSDLLSIFVMIYYMFASGGKNCHHHAIDIDDPSSGIGNLLSA